jgi:hypothetical protein
MGENSLLRDISDKVLIIRIYRELKKLNSPKSMNQQRSEQLN